MAEIELLPFQKEAKAKLLAPGSRKLVIADLGLGTRTIMAHAASQFKDKVIIAPLALRMDWERQPTGHARFISSNTPQVKDYLRGFRQPLAIVEISSLTRIKYDMVLELLTRMDNVWIRLINPSYKDILLLQTHNFEVVRIMYEYGKSLLLKELSEFVVDLPSKSNEEMVYSQGRVAGAILLCDSVDDEKLFHYYQDLIHSEMVRRAANG